MCSLAAGEGEYLILLIFNAFPEGDLKFHLKISLVFFTESLWTESKQ